jgi:elongation factor G
MLHGIGELHLEIVCDKLKRQYNILVQTGRTYVAYRESINKLFYDENVVNGIPKVNRNFIYDKTIAQKKMFASIDFEVEITSENIDPIYSIDDTVKSMLSNDEYTSMHDGLVNALSRGPKGFPIAGINLKVINIEKNGDTSPGSIRACIALFVDNFMRTEAHIILEPIMSLEIEVTSQYVGDILNDLTVQRRAQIKEVKNDDFRTIIDATVPLTSMVGYASICRSISHGEASFSLEYNSHCQVEENVVKTLFK